MALIDSVRYFTEEKHILSCMSVVCGTAGQTSQALGGTRDLAGHPVTEDTIFDLASLTKLVTGLLCFRLREEGLLDLAAPVTRYAPGYRELSDVSVDRVLGFEIALITPQRVDAQPDAETGLRMLYQIQPRPLGNGRAYSDMHAMVLRHILEGASGQSYMELFRSRLAGPLGLKDMDCHVAQPERCASCDREHRIEKGRYILRDGIAPGTPHDPKQRLLYPDGSACAGHAGLFGTIGDVAALAQGVLRGEVVSDESLRRMAQNRTGHLLPDDSWTQFLGSQCYVRHPVQYHSEIPEYESDRAIGVSGFTGHHLSIDPERGIFVCYLGDRVLDRLSVLVPEEGKTREDYGLSADGSGQVRWPDGSLVWSSVDYVHQKDEHFHREVRRELML